VGIIFAHAEWYTVLHYGDTTMAIDVHAHVGRFEGAPWSLLNTLRSGDFNVVRNRAEEARVRSTFVSPLRALMPRGNGDPLAGNSELASEIDAQPGIFQWVVLDPTNPATYAQAEEILRTPRCVGIKIHPEEHRYSISDHGEAIFEFASEHGAIVMSHSGEAQSMPEDFLPFADSHPDVPLIVSHLGCGFDQDVTHQVNVVRDARQRNVYTDTSSATSIARGLIEWAVEEIGHDRILFGTDSPLYDAPMQRARIDHADISDEAKKAILYANAERLFGHIIAGHEQG
jgi:uncharacterized protein